MKKIFWVIILIAITVSAQAQTVIVTDDNSYTSGQASAVLDAKSTTKGILMPRMTATQKNAISSPATGLIIYQTDSTSGFYYFNGTGWVGIAGSSGANQWLTSGSDVYYNTGKVGIGTNAPNTPLHVKTTTPTTGSVTPVLIEGEQSAGANNMVSMQLRNTSSANSKTGVIFGGPTSTTQWILGNDSAGNNGNNFYLYDFNANLPRLYINGSNSNVGINTSAPLAAFDVHDSDTGVAGNVKHRLYRNSAGDVGMSFQQAAVGSYGIVYRNETTTPAKAKGRLSFVRNYSPTSAGTEVMSLDSFGRLGIGVDSPTQKLDVNGNFKFSGAIMPGNNAGTLGYVLTSGGVGGTPTWTDPASYLTSGWQLAGNTVATPQKLGTLSYHDLPIVTNNVEKMRVMADGKIGIGKSNPTEILDVVGNIRFSGALMPNNLPGAAGSFLMSNGAAAVPTWADAWKPAGNNMNTSGVQNLGTSTSHDLPIVTVNIERMRIKTDGKVGIATNAPNQMLDVNGNVAFSGALMPNNNAGLAGYFLTSSGTNTPPTWTNPVTLAWKPGGNDMNSSGVQYLGTTSYTDLPIITAGAGAGFTRIMIKADGKVGISNVAPAQALDVTGNVAFSGALMPNNSAGLSGYFLTSSGAGTAPTWTDPATLSWKPGGNTFSAMQIFGTASHHDIPIYTANAERMRILTNGRVGIGTTAPNQVLDVNGNVALSGALMPNNNAGLTGYFLTSAGTNAAPTWTNPATLAWKPGGNDMNSVGIQNFGTTSYHDLPIITNNGEKVRIKADGKVGIGNAAPSEILDVTGNVRFSGALMPNNLAGASGAFLMSNGTNTAPTWGTAWKPGGNDMNSLGVQYFGTTSYTDLPIITAGAASGNTRIMIKADGKVGISNVSPSEALDVTGNVRFSGALMPNNQAGTSGYILQSAGTNSPPVWVNPSTLGGGGGSDWSLGGNAVGSMQNFGTTSNYALPFVTNGGERMRILTDGKVGIAKAAPTEILDVQGNFRLSGAFMPNNAAGTTGNILLSGGAGNPPTWASTATVIGTNAWTPGGTAVASALSLGTSSNFDLPFVTNGGERMRILTDGKVGIAKAAPTEILDVQGNFRLSGAFMPNNAAGTTGYVLQSAGAGNPPTWGNPATLYWGVGGNAVAAESNFGTTSNFNLPFITNNTEKMRLTTAGHLGVGITTPSSRLHVVGDGTDAGNNFVFEDYGTTTPGIYIRKGRGTLGSPANLATDDIIGQIKWVARYNGGIGTTNGSGIDVYYRGSGTTDLTDMRFSTSSTERMRIESDGEVGIGAAATNPTATLDVGGTVKLGTAGTVLTNIIKTSVTLSNTSTNAAPTDPLEINFTVTGANLNATVIMNPRGADLPTKMSIAYCYVVSANTVRVVFSSTNGNVQLGSNKVFDVTIIQ